MVRRTAKKSRVRSASSDRQRRAPRTQSRVDPAEKRRRKDPAQRAIPAVVNDFPTDSIAEEQFVNFADPNPLGGVTREDVASVAVAAYGVDPELDTRETSIAVEGLARSIIARLENPAASGDPRRLSIFLLSDRPRDLARELNAKKEPILDNGSLQLAGSLWISGPTFVSGYRVALAGTDTGSMFDEVSQKGVGDLPAFVFDPSATEAEIRYYPGGLDEPDYVQRFIISEKVFTLDALDRVLTAFHESNIIAPDAAGRSFNPWQESKKYIPRTDAEAFLQGGLKLAITVAFQRKCTVRFEVRGTEGRCDLLVVSRDPKKSNAWLHHAAMELKVLRSFSSRLTPVSSAVRRKALEKGLEQAISYKKEHGATIGLLCCFDMRSPAHADGTACFALINRRAAKRAIELRLFRLYGSVVDLRSDKYGESSDA